MQAIDAGLVLEIIWFIVLVAIVSLLVWLSIRLLEGKSSEEGKRFFKAFGVALLGTLIAVGVYAAFSAIPYFSQFIIGAAPYLVYIFWLLLVHAIFDASWKDSIIVSFIALLFIVIFVSVMQLVNVNTYMFTALRA